MLVSDIINEAFLDLGAIAAGETITTAEQTDAFNRLNLIIDQWSREELTAFAQVHGSYSLVAGTTDYTLGTGGSFVTANAPMRVTGGRVVSGSFSGPLELVSFPQLDARAKDGLGETAALPEMMAADQGWPTIALRFFPTPAGGTAKIDYWIALTPFATVGDTINLPPAFTAALEKNLALHLFPQYARPGSTANIIAGLAESTKASIVDLNSRVLREAPPAPPAKKAA